MVVVVVAKVIMLLYIQRLSTKRVRIASPGIIILKLLFMLSIVRLLELESEEKGNINELMNNILNKIV